MVQRRLFARAGRSLLVAALVGTTVVLGVTTGAPPASAAAPVVDLFSPGTITLTQEDGDQAARTNHIYAMAIIRHDAGTNVNGVRFDLVHNTSGGTYGGTNCSTTQHITCSGGYIGSGGWTYGGGQAFTMTTRELPGQATATTNTNSNYTQVWIDIKPRSGNSWQNDGPDGSNNGICGLEGGGPRLCKNTASFSFRTSDGQTTADQTLQYWTVGENDGSGEDFPAVYATTSTDQSTVTAGSQGAVTIGYTCDDNDGGGGNSCDSARVRFRRAGDNATVNPGPSSDASGNLTCAQAVGSPDCETRTNNGNYVVGLFNADDNVARSYTYRAPRSRGLYYIEASFCNDDGLCPHGSVPSTSPAFSDTASFLGQTGTMWQLLGSFYVNDAGPTVSIDTPTQTGGSSVNTNAFTGALHPNTGATMNLAVTTSSDTQIVDWNTNQNNGDGINSSGYETRTYGTMSYASSAGTPTVTKTTTLNLGSYAAGANCAVAARVYDTGAVNATDQTTQSATTSKTCTTNNLPVGTAQTNVQTARSANTAITLAASDADRWTNAVFSGANGDEAPTIAITQPTEGTVTCSAFAATSATAGGFPCTYAVPANATPGPFSFSYQVTDSHLGSSVARTVTGTIKPLISGVATPAANGNGWNNTNVTVNWTCTSSALSSCSSPSALTTEAANQSATGTAVDNIGNTATATVSGINIDKTQPNASAALGASPNGAGWFNADVPVTFTCSDALSGVTPGDCASGTITGEGASLSLTRSVTDLAGNSRSVTSPTAKIDRTAPATSISAIPTWSTSSVSATLTPTDNLSGVALTRYAVDGGPTQTGTTVNVSGNGVHTVQYWSVDAAGNTETTRSATVRIDGTAPTISASVAPTPNLAGWNNTDATVTFTCSDALSGIASCTSPVSVTTEGAGQNVPGSATDVAGNTSSTSATVNLDKTVPTISASRPSANANGWYNADVVVNFTCADALSGVASCTAPQTVSTEGADQSVSGSAADAAGNGASATSSDIDIDKTAPTISAEVSSEANARGYWIGPVTVTFTCADALSGIGSGGCPDPIEVTASGHQEVTGTATDRAGNTSSTTVELEMAGPVPTITAERTPAANPAGWNNESVVVSFTCASDALETCTSPITLSADGADQSATGTVTDAYGQSASTTLSGVNIDKSLPTISGLATTAPNGAGWYKAPVPMHWTCTDPLSGIAPGACPADSLASGEGLSVTASATVSDRAGNVGNGVSESVQIDVTAPSTTVDDPPTWSASDVTLDLVAVDNLSGVATTSYSVDGGAPQVGTDPHVSGTGVHTVTFWSTDVAGNVESTQSVQVAIDVDAPSISAQSTPMPNVNGWNNAPVTVSFICTDATSGVASCTTGQVYSSEVDTTAVGTAVDNAGNTATASAAVRIDLTAPTVTVHQPSPNGNGWFNAPVQITFTCADLGGSGIGDDCPAPQMFSGEGEDQAVTATATDRAGNQGSGTGTPLDIDLTAPTISGAATTAPNPGGGYYGSVTVQWTCADALSGVASCPANQVVSGEGVHVVSASVEDRAGNSSTAEVTIRIDHDPSTDPGIVTGIVTDAQTESPLAGVLVRLHAPNGALTTMYSTTTGTDGRYTFPAIADGSYLLSFTKWGTHLQAWNANKANSAHADPITIGHGSVVEIGQALAPGYTLSGRLTSAAGGGPVSGATVSVSGGGQTYQATSDANGNYQVTGMVAGTRTATVLAYGYQSSATSVVSPGTSTLNMALTPAAGVGLKGSVTAVSPAGRAAPGAVIKVYVKGAVNPGLQVTTGSDGRYQVPQVAFGQYELSVTRAYNRWYGDVAGRSLGTIFTIAPGCAPNAEPAWGDPCAYVANFKLPTA